MGPHAVWHALQPLNPTINLHFLSTVDGTLLDRILSRCRPESTLAIVSSKSFGTRETMVNAEMVDAWFARAGITGERRYEHIVTVSSKEGAAESLASEKRTASRSGPGWAAASRYGARSDCRLPLDWAERRSSLSFGVPMQWTSMLSMHLYRKTCRR